MLTAVESPVRIHVAGVAASGTGGKWRVTWLITNVSPATLRVEDAWVPHGRFRGDGHIGLALEIGSGGSAPLELAVRALEPVGTVVENAFVILRVRSGSYSLGVFAGW